MYKNVQDLPLVGRKLLAHHQTHHLIAVYRHVPATKNRFHSPDHVTAVDIYHWLVLSPPPWPSQG